MNPTTHCMLSQGRSLSCVECDGVNRSTGTDLFCSSVYFVDSVRTKANYPYPVASAAAVSTEGYTPAAPMVRPAAHLRRALGIIPSANKTRNSLLLDSLFFDTPSLCSLCIVQHVLGDSFFFFEPPPPPLTRVCWGLRLG